MKKTYVKPTIQFESFKMSTNIAGNCNREQPHENGDTCTLEDYGTMLFSESNAACEHIIDGDFCYDVPSANLVIFAS